MGVRIRDVDRLLLQDALDSRPADMYACPCQLVGNFHLAKCRAEQLDLLTRRSERNPEIGSRVLESERANHRRFVAAMPGWCRQ